MALPPKSQPSSLPPLFLGWDGLPNTVSAVWPIEKLGAPLSPRASGRSVNLRVLVVIFKGNSLIHIYMHYIKLYAMSRLKLNFDCYLIQNVSFDSSDLLSFPVFFWFAPKWENFEIQLCHVYPTSSLGIFKEKVCFHICPNLGLYLHSDGPVPPPWKI